ncbi:MAG: hypothetical protein AAF810_01485 [Cyanobacteria bacterium P01_D01_bin.36]
MINDRITVTHPSSISPATALNFAAESIKYWEKIENWSDGAVVSFPAHYKTSTRTTIVGWSVKVWKE